MVDVHRLARAQRTELLAIDSELAKALVNTYSVAWQRIRVRVDTVTADIAAAGDDVSPALLLRLDSLRQMEQAIVAELVQVARSANGSISAAQWRSINLAQEHARAFVEAAMGETPPGVVFSWFLPPAEATRQMVGMLGDGQPLAALLDQLGPDAARAVREALSTGVALGEPVQTIARRARTAFGGNMGRALTVSRQSVMQSYREASRATFNQNTDVVKGWRWLASKSVRTCLACLARDGSEWPLEKPLPAHVRCRCTLTPIVRTWAEMGYDVPEVPQTGETGQEWFDRQDDDTKRRMMSAAAFRALDAGKVSLTDFAGLRSAGRWGDQTYERSLTQILGADRARAFYRQEVVVG